MAVFEIEGPDGETYEVEAPNEAAVADAVQQMFSQPSSPARLQEAALPDNAPLQAELEADDGGLVDTILGGLGYAGHTANVAAHGVANGAMNVLGLPVDAVNAIPMLANLLPGEQGVGPISDYPIGGSQSLKDLFYLNHHNAKEAFLPSEDGATSESQGGIITKPEPEDAVQRFVERIGEEVGAASVPVAGAIGAAARKPMSAIRSMPRFQVSKPATYVDGIKRGFQEQAKLNPQKLATKETVLATGAGAGAQTANELYGGGENPWVDALGAIAGAGATAASKSIGGAVRDVASSLQRGGKITDEVVIDAVLRDIAANAGIKTAPKDDPDLTSLINAVEGNRKVADTVPGFQESLADRTQNPGLAALEYSRQSGPNAGAYKQALMENTEAVDQTLSKMEPVEQPGKFREALESNRTQQLDEANAKTSLVQSAFDDAVENLQPAMTATERGATVRTALEDASAEAKELLEKAWKPVNENQAGVPVDQLDEAFAEVGEGLSKAERMRFTPEEAGIPGSFIDPQDPTTAVQPVKEVFGIRSALTDAQREAASAGRNNQARVIGQYVDQLDEFLDNSVPDSLRADYDAAKAATREYNDRFARPQTAIAKTLAKREGLAREPDSLTPKKFVQSDEGRLGDFEALMKEAGDSDGVKSAIRDQVLQDVKAKGLIDKPEKLAQYLNGHSKVFEKFPELKRELGSAGALRGQLDKVQTAEKSLQKTLNEGAGAVAKYLRYGDEKADMAMKGVLGSADPAKSMDELLTFVGDEAKAVEGARRAYWNAMQKQARSGGNTTAPMNGAQPWAPVALKRFLDDPANSAVAERLYRDKPEHLKDIRAVTEALQGVDTRNSMRATNTSGTAQAMSQILTPESIQSRLYAYGSGRISGTFLVSSFASVLARRSVRAARSEAVGKLLDDVLVNPDAAALLMKQNNPINRQAFAVKAKAWFGSEASTIVNAMSADEKDEQTEAINSK